VLSYVDQGRDLDDEVRVGDAVGGGLADIVVGSKSLPIMAWLAKFNLAGSMAGKRVASLSGGERSRVHLARALRTPTNFLILDEPTNDLDVDTLRSLEEAINDFPGCVVIVSHDRYFLDRVCTHTLVLGANHQGSATFHEGTVSEVQS
jgi:ATPase subunit of ABC transporter with duplicated ATPase domains